jgi:GntR family transcriptional regulator
VIPKLQKRPANQNQLLLGKGVSLYIQLATLFRRQIESGQWKMGEQIPTIEELSAMHGASIATVRHALSILASQNLISCFSGRGTFVIHHPEEKRWCEVCSDWKGLLRTRQGATIETLSETKTRDVTSFPDSAGKISGAYRHTRRRHWRNEEAFLLSNLFIAESLFARAQPDALAKKTSLQFISEIPGLKLAALRQVVTIGLADVEIAEKLNLDLNAPVAIVHRYASDADNHLIFACESIYRGDVFCLNADIDLRQMCG